MCDSGLGDLPQELLVKIGCFKGVFELLREVCPAMKAVLEASATKFYMKGVHQGPEHFNERFPVLER